MLVVNSQLGDLIDDLVVTTDRLIMGSPTSSVSLRSSGQMAKTQISPDSLVWSVALRACPDILIQASIEYVDHLPNLSLSYIWSPELDGFASISTLPSQANSENYFRSGYWRNLQSSLILASQTLKSCVNVIHGDIVEIWNLNDKDRVSCRQFPCCFHLLTGISICRAQDLRKRCLIL